MCRSLVPFWDLKTPLREAVPENVIHPYSHIPSQMEIMDSFFKPHRIIVNWINCYGMYGEYDFEQRKWTGMVGKVGIFLKKYLVQQ